MLQTKLGIKILFANLKFTKNLTLIKLEGNLPFLLEALKRNAQF